MNFIEGPHRSQVSLLLPCINDQLDREPLEQRFDGAILLLKWKKHYRASTSWKHHGYTHRPSSNAAIANFAAHLWWLG